MATRRFRFAYRPGFVLARHGIDFERVVGYCGRSEQGMLED